MTSIAASLDRTSKSRIDPSRYPLLDEKQVGSIRHMGNLARQQKNDWSGMMGPTPLSEDFGAYKYQLAYMSYALALAHYHRLPAAPGLFRDTFQRLIQKMLLPDVWFEWHDTSKGGGLLNIEAPETEGWIDPIVKDNIMYSAYLQSMTLLYNVIFDDDRYAQPGALTLSYTPLFWGGQKGFTFEYDQNSVNERVYWNMVENGYLGVACEPHCVFQICNQPPILGFKFHDHLTGGNTAKEVTEGYLAAWQEFGGLLDERGHYNTLIKTYIKQRVPGVDTSSDAWCGALMNAWNSEFVHENYERQREVWRKFGPDGTISVNLVPPLRTDMHPAVLGGFGWLSVWASEMGDSETLQGLLAHADRYMSPQYTKGGYHYPRNDEMYDEDGNLTAILPVQSNALLPYARLNVPNGLNIFYNNMWGREHFLEPALDEVSFALDVLRAVYDSPSDTLLFDVARSEGHKPGTILVSKVFDRGSWNLAREGQDIAWGSSNAVGGTADIDDVKIEREGSGLRITVNHFAPASYTLTWNR